MDTQTIRQGLYNIKSRAATMDALIEKGNEVATAVVPLLQDRDEGIRWAAIRILAEIGDEGVILPLVSLLDQSRNVPEVIRALQTITGQNLGDKAIAWREWALQKQTGNGSLPAGLLSDKDLMAAAIKDLQVTMSGEDQEYVVSVPLPDRRTQNIRIDFSGMDTDGQPVVQLTTPCGPAVAEEYEAVLKLNMTIPYGAIGLALLDDTLYFALIHTHLRATVHPEDIAKAIMCLARHGDSLERALSPKDTY
ncbi:MAG: HEAT repeat domain-containing protein [bacterium]